jgi:hypothetical protein
MVECAECCESFLPQKKKQQWCSSRCYSKHWKRNNKDSYKAYMKKWRAENPSNIEKYNVRRRQERREIFCKECETIFLTKYSQTRYCSTKCRGKARRNRPGEKHKERLRQRTWLRKNKEKANAYGRTYYKHYVQKKMTAQPWSTLLVGAKQRAKNKKLAFNLTPEWAASRWTGYCEITGLPFSEPSKRVGHKNRNMSPSIDRIIPAGGYTQNNCRIILWAVNCFKRDSSDAEMLKIAKALVTRISRRD